jgi:hypothetical protein
MKRNIYIVDTYGFNASETIMVDYFESALLKPCVRSSVKSVTGEAYLIISRSGG